MVLPAMAPLPPAAEEGPVTFRGMCDASAGWMVEGRLLAISDEDQERTYLRFFDALKGGRALLSVPLDASKLKLEPKRKEIDIEGLARIGDLYFAIGSHSRNKEGKPRGSRQRLFTFRLPEGGPTSAVPVEGVPYTTLLVDLGKHLKKEIGLAELDPPLDPKAGGVSIEGLAGTPGGDLLIGFRSPLWQRKAMVATLTNPRKLMEGNRAKFGAAVLLDLHGGGIRDIVWSGARKEYLLISGAVAAGGTFGLYAWDGEASGRTRKLAELSAVTPRGASPEALVLPEKEDGRALVLFDEGARPVAGGKQCKDLPAEQASFRGVWLRLPR